MALNYDDARQNPKVHNIILENRKFMTISGVSDIDSFDEQSVILFTDLGDIEVRGNNLHINKLNVDSGEVHIEGEIFALIYNDNIKTSGNFWSKLFK
ncbi:MAG: sporulation protein YabP [Oscillospiraceae bacterium]